MNPCDVNIMSKTRNINDILDDLYNDAYVQNSSIKWDHVRMSQYIESMLIRFPLSPIWLSGLIAGSYYIIDGYQRIHTINEFVIKRSFKLKELKFLHELEGLTFTELSNPMRRRITLSGLMIHIIALGTPDDVEQNLIKRIRG